MPKKLLLIGLLSTIELFGQVVVDKDLARRSVWQAVAHNTVRQPGKHWTLIDGYKLLAIYGSNPRITPQESAKQLAQWRGTVAAFRSMPEDLATVVANTAVLGLSLHPRLRPGAKAVGAFVVAIGADLYKSTAAGNFDAGIAETLRERANNERVLWYRLCEKAIADPNGFGKALEATLVKESLGVSPLQTLEELLEKHPEYRGAPEVVAVMNPSGRVSDNTLKAIAGERSEKVRHATAQLKPPPNTPSRRSAQSRGRSAEETERWVRQEKAKYDELRNQFELAAALSMWLPNGEVTRFVRKAAAIGIAAVNIANSQLLLAAGAITPVGAALAGMQSINSLLPLLSSEPDGHTQALRALSEQIADLRVEMMAEFDRLNAKVDYLLGLAEGILDGIVELRRTGEDLRYLSAQNLIAIATLGNELRQSIAALGERVDRQQQLTCLAKFRLREDRTSPATLHSCLQLFHSVGTRNATDDISLGPAFSRSWASVTGDFQLNEDFGNKPRYVAGMAQQLGSSFSGQTTNPLVWVSAANDFASLVEFNLVPAKSLKQVREWLDGLIQQGELSDMMLSNIGGADERDRKVFLTNAVSTYTATYQRVAALLVDVEEAVQIDLGEVESKRENDFVPNAEPLTMCNSYDFTDAPKRRLVDRVVLPMHGFALKDLPRHIRIQLQERQLPLTVCIQDMRIASVNFNPNAVFSTTHAIKWKFRVDVGGKWHNFEVDLPSRPDGPLLLLAQQDWNTDGGGLVSTFWQRLVAVLESQDAKRDNNRAIGISLKQSNPVRYRRELYKKISESQIAGKPLYVAVNELDGIKLALRALMGFAMPNTSAQNPRLRRFLGPASSGGIFDSIDLAELRSCAPIDNLGLVRHVNFDLLAPKPCREDDLQYIHSSGFQSYFDRRTGDFSAFISGLEYRGEHHLFVELALARLVVLRALF
jgi:hypothetical protein